MNKALCRSWSLAVLYALSALAIHAAPSPLPEISGVETQPLLAQIRRVQETLDFLGQPLPRSAIRSLEAAGRERDPKAVARAIQEALDPLCIGFLRIDSRTNLTFAISPQPPDLLEQGWRVVFLKVENLASSESSLRVDSPAARPLAGTPASGLADRWLDIESFDQRPMQPALGGLKLEYRVLQLWAREPGTHKAKIGFKLGEAESKERVSRDRRTEKRSETLGPDWASAEMAFTVEPAFRVKFNVHDEHGQPATAAFVIRDTHGRIYPTPAKRLAPDFFFHSQVYRANGETVTLPAGDFVVECSRGPESIVETNKLRVTGPDSTFRYRVKRWVDPAARGWFSGDHHIHAAGCAHYANPTEGVAPEDMQRHIMGEDLKVGCNLTWGPGFDFQKQFFCGKVDQVSKYPYLLRYDIEVSGFGSHESGHLCLLRLKEQIPPGGMSKDHWPTLGLNTLRWAQRQGAVCGTAHSAAGLGGEVSRVDGPEGPNGLPHYRVPRYDGIGANEFIVDVTHRVPGPAGQPVPAIDFLATMNTDRKTEFNIWYHVLNCGFRPRVSGETDFPCVSGARVGLGRVYVRQDGRLDFDDWCEGIRQGRSYVSDGTAHLMDLTLQTGGTDSKPLRLGEGESEVRLAGEGKVRLSVVAAIRRPETNQIPVEVVVNGFPVAEKWIKPDGKEQRLTFEIPIERSSWVAVRAWPRAHTNPFFVIVGDRPIRASRRSAEWCLRSVDQCWSQKERFYQGAERDQARADYEHARSAYRAVLAEAAAD